jgi:fructokinase
MGGARRRPLAVFWGELLWDEFPDGRRLGGAPANAAYHAAALGLRAALVSRVGRDRAGDDALAALAARGVDTRFVQRDDAPTGSVAVVVRGEQVRYAIRAPAAWDRIVCDDAVVALVARADAFVYGTLARRAPNAGGAAALARALALLPPRCLRICDLNLRAPFDDAAAIRAAVATADVVKLNRDEASAVASAIGCADPIRWLLGRAGVSLIALTRGAEGSELVTPTARFEHRGARATAGDPVGAGDAYTAALVLHLLRRTPLDEAGELANRYAGFVAGCRGAMPPIPGDLRRAVAGR